MADVIFRHHFSELCSLTNVTVMELSNGHYNEMCSNLNDAPPP